MRSFVEKTLFRFQENRNKYLGAIALMLIGYSFYNPALRFAPVDFDDLVLLSHVKNTSNPFTFFIGDWGFGNYGYRPLHSLSLWAGYQLFGVSSGPNQLFNLILHITVIILLYALLLKLQKNNGLAFIFSAVSLVSLYTFSPPTWVSDRPTLFVGLFLMLMLNYLFSLGKDKQPSIPVLAAISFLALMSKESGLVVPLTAGAFLLFSKNGFKQEKSALITIGAVVLLYAVLRFFLFGASAGTYDEAGYLFGYRYYETAASLTSIERHLSFFENLIKNFAAVFLPVFDGRGKLSLIGTLGNSVILVGTTMILAILGFSKKINRYQVIGLVIILFNAVLHFQVFRYRTLYLAQLGFSIFLAASDRFSEGGFIWKVTAFIVAVVLVLWSIHIIGEDITYIYLDRYNLLHQPDFKQMILSSSSRIDAQVVQRIIEKYRH